MVPQLPAPGGLRWHHCVSAHWFFLGGPLTVGILLTAGDVGWLVGWLDSGEVVFFGLTRWMISNLTYEYFAFFSLVLFVYICIYIYIQIIYGHIYIYICFYVYLSFVKPHSYFRICTNDTVSHFDIDAYEFSFNLMKTNPNTLCQNRAAANTFASLTWKLPTNLRRYPKDNKFPEYRTCKFQEDAAARNNVTCTCKCYMEFRIPGSFLEHYKWSHLATRPLPMCVSLKALDFCSQRTFRGFICCAKICRKGKVSKKHGKQTL